MPKVGKNIYKRKDGRWEGRFAKSRDMNGRVIYGSVYARTYAEAKQRLVASLVEELPLAADLTECDKHNLTFAEVTIQWLSAVSLKLKPSTYAGYRAMLDLHILPSLGKYKIQNLTATDVSRLAGDKLENGRTDGKGGLSAKTVKDMLSIIKTVVNFACQENIISNAFTINYPKQQRQKMRVLSRQEQASLEMALVSGISIHKLGILLCLYTGLRIGEVCALRWQDISPDFATLSVRQTLQRVKDTTGENSKTKILIDAPKSLQSVRDIPIPKFFSIYLQDFLRNGAVYFLSTEEIAFTEPRTMQNHFARVTGVANIKNVNFHSLRHTFATRCIEAGVDVKSLSEILGHASVNITLNCYVHSSFEQKREGMNKLEQYIGI